MPLLRKASKAKLDHSPPVVSTPPTSSDGFKSLFKKRSASPSKPAPQYGYSGTSKPKPILRPAPPASSALSTSPRQQSPAPASTIRFAGMGGVSEKSASCAQATAQPPTVPEIVSNVDSQRKSHAWPDSPVIPLRSPARAAAQSPPYMARPVQTTRRSSRPTSPATYSFGARTTIASAMMTSSSICHTGSSPSSSPTSPAGSARSSYSRQVSTPPTSHPPTMPSSPCGRRRSQRLPVDSERRRATLYRDPVTSAPGTPVSILAAEEGVPMLNVIPATPQEDGDDFAQVEHPAPVTGGVMAEETAERVAAVEIGAVEPEIEGLAEVASLAQVAERQLEYMEATEHFDASFAQPQLDLSFNFSSFAPLDIRPSSPINLSFEPERPVSFDKEGPVSPPFESYPSLPSLSSNISNNDIDMESSDSESSTHEFVDVEEALGLMLASLSDVRLSDLPELGDVPELPALPPTPKISEDAKVGGFGLGFDLDMGRMGTVTAPLSPRRRRPPPLDLSKRKMFTPLPRLPPANSSSEGDFGRRTLEDRAPTSAPLYNHRTGFYHPKAASAASMSQGLGTLPSFGAFNMDWDLPSDLSRRLIVDTEEIDPSSSHKRTASDAISILSEASDDDLHTVSIISLTPILANGRVDMREEVLNTEVGVAY